MDRGLLARALIIGIICFIIAVCGLYYLSLTEEQSNRQYEEISRTTYHDSGSIGAIGIVFLLIIGFIALTIAAGVITALSSTVLPARPGDIFLASALAGGTPVMLLSAIFWCLCLVNIVRALFNHESFGNNDLIFVAYALGINALLVGLGALIAGLSGYVTHVFVRVIARPSG
jgi:hypothetical protein